MTTLLYFQLVYGALVCGVGGFILLTVKVLPISAFFIYKYLEVTLCKCGDMQCTLTFLPFVIVGLCGIVVAIPVVFLFLVVTRRNIVHAQNISRRIITLRERCS